MEQRNIRNLTTSRNLTVSSGGDSKYNPVPFIRLQGKWLVELGFDIGDKIVVECQDERLVITKAKSGLK